MRVPAVAVNVTAGKFGPLGLSVGFQTRPSGWDCGTPIQWGYAVDHFRLLNVGWIGPAERSGVHRIERPATRSYALVPVEIK